MDRLQIVIHAGFGADVNPPAAAVSLGRFGGPFQLGREHYRRGGMSFNLTLALPSNTS
jgi:hypothetical protein